MHTPLGRVTYRQDWLNIQNKRLESRKGDQERDTSRFWDEHRLHDTMEAHDHRCEGWWAPFPRRYSNWGHRDQCWLHHCQEWPWLHVIEVRENLVEPQWDFLLDARWLQISLCIPRTERHRLYWLYCGSGRACQRHWEAEEPVCITWRWHHTQKSWFAAS